MRKNIGENTQEISQSRSPLEAPKRRRDEGKLGQNKRYSKSQRHKEELQQRDRLKTVRRKTTGRLNLVLFVRNLV